MKLENENSVCYIDKVKEIIPIEKADKIELAVVNGWKSIVPKNTLKVDDLVLCITTDAVIPQEFGEKHGILTYLRKGNRVRTVKLRGIYSDCIVIPVSDIWEELPQKGFGLERDPEYIKLGTDLMDTFGIFKYEEPEKIITLPGGRRIIQKDNPNFDKYYKFPNIKNVPDIFTEEDDVIVTRKYHGSNARYGIVKKVNFSFWDKIKKFLKLSNKWDDYTYIYGSHNVIKGSEEAGFYSTDIWKEVADKYNIKEKLWNFVKSRKSEDLGSGIILYGEIYGPGVQGEHFTYNCKNRELILFDIQLDKEYLDRATFVQFAKSMELPHTLRLYKGKFDINTIMNYVLNQFIPNTKTPHEGVVVSHVSGDRKKIAKIINPDYLIFGEKHSVPENH